MDPNVNAVSAFVNQNEIEIMTRLNAELKEKLGDPELRTRFNDNVDLIRDLMFEITERVQQSQPQLEFGVSGQRASHNRLDHVFEVLNL